MDRYPESLSPGFLESGAVATTFEEWWPRVKDHFPNVPQNLAQYWLHEHWGHSPFSWIPSQEYDFDRIAWPAEMLSYVRSGWSNFSEEQIELIDHGRYLVEDIQSYRTATYMRDNKEFPEPIIILDNTDDHLSHLEAAKKHPVTIPASFVLIEGHRRLNIALYLMSINEFATTADIWLLKKRTFPRPSS